MTDEDAELLKILQNAEGKGYITGRDPTTYSLPVIPSEMTLVLRITERDRARLVQALEHFAMEDAIAKSEAIRG